MSARFDDTERVIELIFERLPLDLLARHRLRLDLEEIIDQGIERGIAREREEALLG